MLLSDSVATVAGTMAATAGGSHVCIWDVLGGGRLVARLSNHQKTVTSLAMSPLAGPASSAAPRLLTGSLDGHIKIFELDQFKVCLVHMKRWPNTQAKEHVCNTTADILCICQCEVDLLHPLTCQQPFTSCLRAQLAAATEEAWH